MIKYGSVCAGIEAATVAFHGLGWQPIFFSEIDKFPSKILAKHYPNVPNYGDLNKYKEWPLEEKIDLLIGGTPCQSFSLAGLREGLDDPRGNLMLTYLGLAEKTKPRWVIWENVPGVLSSNKGRDFGTFLGALGKLGYGFAYRVLDAQYFGVAQRRKRIYVVGYLGDWRRAASVLFESESLQRDFKKSRPKEEEYIASTEEGFHYSRTRGFIKCPETLIAKPLGARGGVGRMDLDNDTYIPEISFCLNAGEMIRYDHTSETFLVQNSNSKIRVRRLTPLECERIQGFPDNYTNISTKDGPRYKAIGNSMAVPVIKWIGSRIELADNIV